MLTVRAVCCESTVSPRSDVPSGAGPPVGPAPGRPVALDRRFDRDGLVPLREAVADVAEALGVPGDRVERVVLVAYELASNAVRHGGGHGRLLLETRDSTLGCTVIDGGGGFHDPDRAGLVQPSPTALGGRGLWLVRCIADSVEIRSGAAGTTAVAQFALR